MTTHSLVSNTFEFSLQLVNPKLTLPYWDWTIEGVEALKASAGGEVEIKSLLFTAGWFGSADPEDGVVSERTRTAETTHDMKCGRNIYLHDRGVEDTNRREPVHGRVECRARDARGSLCHGSAFS